MYFFFLNSSVQDTWRMLTRVGVASARFFLTHLRCIRRNAHSKNLQSSQAPSRVWRHGKRSVATPPTSSRTYSLSCNVAGLSVQRAGDQLRAVAQGFECSNITTSLTSFSFAHNNTFSFCSRLPPPPPDSKGLCH